MNPDDALDAIAAMESAITLICEGILDWCEEYGFNVPEQAKIYWDYVDNKRPELTEERTP